MSIFKENYKEMGPTDIKYTIEGPVDSNTLSRYTFHQDIGAFRIADKQHQALMKVAEMDGGRIIIARAGRTVIGYLAFSFPDDIEHWALGKMKDLLELGAIEVARSFRGHHVALEMLRYAFLNPVFEHYIVITTLYYWHWDLKNTGLSVWDYQKMIKKVLERVGFKEYTTSEAEIQSDPANLLMARIGKDVSQSSIEKFDLLRFNKLKNT